MRDKIGCYVRLLSSRARRFGVSISLVTAFLCLPALATDETETLTTIRTATVTGLTTVQQALLGIISDIIPVAIVVMGSMLVVTVGRRLFMRFAG